MLAISSIISPPAITEEQEVESLDNPIDGSIEREYRNVFLQNGITDKSIQDRLIGKIENGELIDADNPESEPIRSEETEEYGRVTKKNIYQDGSVSTVEMGPSRYATRGTGISNCRSYDHLNWVRHDNCRVVYNGIAFSYSFYADYSTAKSGKANATIRNMHSPIIHRAIGHTTSSPSLEITQQWQNRNISPASARMSFQATAVKVLWTTTLSLTLEVSGGRAQALS